MKAVPPQAYDTLILSDLHLGADMSRAREALRVLRENQYRRLILLGDIFADLNFGRLKKEHWKFLSFIRKLSNPKRNVEVVWVEGNHDHGLTEIMSHLVGVRVYQEYQWEYQGLRHIAVHGHQFDGFVVSNVHVSYYIGMMLSKTRSPAKQILGTSVSSTFRNCSTPSTCFVAPPACAFRTSTT